MGAIIKWLSSLHEPENLAVKHTPTPPPKSAAPKGSLDLNKPAGEPDTLSDPSWIVIAKKYVGEREIVGPHHNPLILRWWDQIGMGFDDDETPWCGGFAGGVLVEDGRSLTSVANPASARAYLDMGVSISEPAYGCLVIFWRGSKSGWQGHVGFVVGRDQHDNLMVLGGNQGNMVSIKPYKPRGVPGHRVLGYRWPGIWPYPERFDLPLVNSDGKFLSNEA